MEGPDDRFLGRLWRVQRAGWAGLALFIGAALAGAFGGGPLARVEGTAGGLRVSGERVLRRGAATTFVVRTSGDDFTLRVDGTVRVRAVEPPPLRTVAEEPAAWTFATDGGEARVRLELEAEALGRQDIRFRVGDAAVTVRAFVLP